MRIFVIGIFFCLYSFQVLAQAPQVDEYEWLRMLVDSITEETDLCVNCDMPPEIRSYINPGGEQQFRLRYQCDPHTSTTKLFSATGQTVAVCIVDTIGQDCDSDPDFTGYTFGRDITAIWSCNEGFDCSKVQPGILFPPYEINISGNPCNVGIRELSTSQKFETYEWTDPDGNQSDDSTGIATIPGDYQLVVSEENGCLDTTIFFVSTGEELAPVIEGNLTICDDSGVQLSVSGFESVIWSDGQTTPGATFYNPGPVSVIVQYDSGCIDTVFSTILDERGRSVTIVRPSGEIYEGQSVELSFETFDFTDSDISKVEWTINDAISADSELLFAEINGTTKISLELETISGCFLRDEVTINPLPVNRNIYFSSAFQPTSQLGNNRFFPQSIEGTITLKDMIVYDRWGAPVFSDPLPVLNDANGGWDGTLNGAILPSGIYIYRVDVQFADGSSETKTGTVQIIR